MKAIESFAESLKNYYKNKEMNGIRKKIKKATEEGLFSIEINYNLSGYNESVLRKEGYRVFGSCINGRVSSYISWDGKEEYIPPDPPRQS